MSLLIWLHQRSIAMRDSIAKVVLQPELQQLIKELLDLAKIILSVQRVQLTANGVEMAVKLQITNVLTVKLVSIALKIR